MNHVGSLAGNVATALSRGFDTLDRASRKMAGAAVEMPRGNISAEDIARASEKEDGLVSGVMDLSMARMQVGAGAALMRVYKDITGTLLDVMG
jgi:citrate lyase beta subunit